MSTSNRKQRSCTPVRQCSPAPGGERQLGEVEQGPLSQPAVLSNECKRGRSCSPVPDHVQDTKRLRLFGTDLTNRPCSVNREGVGREGSVSVNRSTSAMLDRSCISLAELDCTKPIRRSPLPCGLPSETLKPLTSKDTSPSERKAKSLLDIFPPGAVAEGKDQMKDGIDIVMPSPSFAPLCRPPPFHILSLPPLDSSALFEAELKELTGAVNRSGFHGLGEHNVSADKLHDLRIDAELTECNYGDLFPEDCFTDCSARTISPFFAADEAPDRFKEETTNLP